MKLYLSSSRLGNKTEILAGWIKTSGDGKIALIPNAGDVWEASNPELCKEKREAHRRLLEEVGFRVKIFDLKHYFGKEGLLRKDLEGYRAFFAVGGNAFVLRQAMKLSGFDMYLTSLKGDDGYLYGGWSAGICVLAESMRGLTVLDDPYANPYGTDVVWDGLGFLEYMPIPHYKSEHSESKLAGKEARNCKKMKMPYKTLRDGEVIFMDTVTGEEVFYTLKEEN